MTTDAEFAIEKERFEAYQQKRWGDWWRRALRKHKSDWFAQANRSLDPDRVNIDQVGHFSSIVPQLHRRVYAFPSKLGRDNFVTLYEEYDARVCDNPWRIDNDGQDSQG